MSGCDSLSYMFSGCRSLKGVELSDWNTSSVRKMDEVFRDCSSLTEIDVSGWNTSNVGSSYDMMAGCDSLRSITVGEGFSLLSRSSLPGIAWVAVSDGTRYRSNKLPSNVAETYDRSNFWHELDKDGNAVITEYDGADEDVVVPASLDGHPVTEIKSFGWLHSQLRSIELPETLIKIDVDAFDDWNISSYVSIPKSLEEGWWAFCGCGGSFTALIEQGTTKIPQGLFWRCPGIVSVDMPDTVTEIGDEAFAHCRSLSEVDLPESLVHLGHWAFLRGFARMCG